MKSHTRLLASILLISAIAAASGCSKNYKVEKSVSNTNIFEQITEESNNVDSMDGKITTSINISDNYSSNVDFSTNIQTTSIEEILKENLYDENIDYNFIISTYVDNYELRDEYKNDYLKAIYMLLINSNVSMKDYLKELHTMIIMQQVPMCGCDETWDEQFKNLIKLDPTCVSLFDKYCDFAIYVHSLECTEKHTENEYYSYSCDALKDEYSRILKKYNY